MHPPSNNAVNPATLAREPMRHLSNAQWKERPDCRRVDGKTRPYVNHASSVRLTTSATPSILFSHSL